MGTNSEPPTPRRFQVPPLTPKSFTSLRRRPLKGQASERGARDSGRYEVGVTGSAGTYTDARHVIAYRGGEVRRQFNVCFRAGLVGGALSVRDESCEVRWFPLPNWRMRRCATPNGCEWSTR